MNDDSKVESKEEEKIFQILEGKFADGKITIPASETSNAILQKNYIGTLLNGEYYEIDGIEALLLLERGRLIVHSEASSSPMTSEQILSTCYAVDSRIWVKYQVYRDLRQRGYMVRAGYGDGIDFRVYPRGMAKAEKAAKYFIVILSEGKPIPLEVLDKVTQQSLASRKGLILAVLDRLGDPTYYKLEQSELPVNQKKDPFFPVEETL